MALIQDTENFSLAAAREERKRVAIAKIVDGFVQGLPEAIKSLEQVMLDENQEQSIYLSHRLRGSAACCGFPELSAALELFENEARQLNRLCVLQELFLKVGHAAQQIIKGGDLCQSLK